MYDSKGKVKIPARAQGHKSLNKCDQNAATRVNTPTCHPGTPGYMRVVTVIVLKVGLCFTTQFRYVVG